MNAASMKLANSVLDGIYSKKKIKRISKDSFFVGNDNDNINFEEVSPPPPPPPAPSDSVIPESPSNIGINPGVINSPSAVCYKSSFFPIKK